MSYLECNQPGLCDGSSCYVEGHQCQSLPQSESSLMAGIDVTDLDKSISCQLWLYKCMLEGCSEAFELLADLRTHYFCVHQTKGQVNVPCCFCLLEFPTWNSSVTSHIASHVHVNSMTCVECQLKFESKNTLMKHLYATHKELPYDVSFDISIRNYERRRFKSKPVAISAVAEKQCEVLPSTSQTDATAAKSSPSSLTSTPHDNNVCEKLMNNLGTTTPMSKIPSNTESVCQSATTFSESNHSEVNESLEVTGDADAGEDVESLDRCAGGRMARRKSRKPMRLSADKETNDVVANVDKSDNEFAEDCVIVGAAVKPMDVQCSHCSYSCNTEIHLKVHRYECHEKPRSCPVNTVAWFTCRHCGEISDSIHRHQTHLAHHRETTRVRVFVCMYCDRRSDSMDVLEEHVSRDHPTEAMKFEVLQLVVNYLQGMMACPVCNGAFTWKEELIRHFGTVHQLEGVVNYLETQCPGQDSQPAECRISRTLFKDLLTPPRNCTTVRIDCIEGHSLERGQRTQPAVDAALGTLPNGDKNVINPRLPVNVESCKSNNSSSADTRHDELQLSDAERSGFPADVRKTSLNGVSNERDADHTILRSAASKDAIQRFHCDDCDFGANSVEELNKHSQKHVLDRASDSADGRISEFSIKGKHSRKHRLKFRCDQCPFASAKLQNLHRHAKIHARAKSLKDGFCCGYCNFVHVHRRCVLFHLSRYHGDRPIYFKRVADGKVLDAGAVGSRAPPDFAPQDSVVLDQKQQRQMNNSAKSFQQRTASPESVHSMSMSSSDSTSAAHLEMELDGVAASRSAKVEKLVCSLPPSMIYSNPVKCPLCDFTNRVRVNLVRHMHLAHGDSRQPSTTATAAANINETDVDKTESNRSQFTDSNSGVGGGCLSSPAANGHVSVGSLLAGVSVGTVGVFVPSISEPVVCSAFDMKCNVSFSSSLSKPTTTAVTASPSSPVLFYRCTLCGFQSARQYSAKQHLVLVHQGIKRFECVICKSVVDSWRTLTTHVFHSHPNQLPLVARHVFKQNDQYFRRHLRKITGYHHMKQDVKQSSYAVENSIVAKIVNTVLESASSKNIAEDTPLRSKVVRRQTFECRKCSYCSDNTTVMKQHVMAHHLNYKPYACPYCSSYPRYVKSFPIARHVKSRHPVEAIRNKQTFLYLRDEEIEKKIRVCYRVIHNQDFQNVSEREMGGKYWKHAEAAADDQSMTKSKTIKSLEVLKQQAELTLVAGESKSKPPTLVSDGTVDSSQDEHRNISVEHDVNSCLETSAVAGSSEPRRFAFAQCCFCGLVARWRADLRYHLMREINYKPFHCGYCKKSSGRVVAEPTKPAMAKHMRQRHPGQVPNIVENRDEAREAEIEQLLKRCAENMSTMTVGGTVGNGEPVPDMDSITSPTRGTDGDGAHRRSNQGVDGGDKTDESSELKSGSDAMVDDEDDDDADDDEDDEDDDGSGSSPSIGSKSAVSAGVVQKSLKRRKRPFMGRARLRRCPYCTYKSSTVKRINKHAVDVHKFAPLHCMYCDFSVHYINTMKRHWLTNHSDTGPFSYKKVDITGSVLSVEPGLSSHEQAALPSPSVEKDRGRDYSLSSPRTVEERSALLSSSEDHDESCSTVNSGQLNELPKLAARREIIHQPRNKVRNTARKSASSYHSSSYSKNDVKSVSYCQPSVLDTNATAQTNSFNETELLMGDIDDVRYCCEFCTASFSSADSLTLHVDLEHKAAAAAAAAAAATVTAVSHGQQMLLNESDVDSLLSGDDDDVVEVTSSSQPIIRLVDIRWGLNPRKSDSTETSESDS